MHGQGQVALALALCVGLVPGCLFAPGEPAQIFVLEHALTLPAGHDPLGASPGRQCHGAEIDGDLVRVHASNHEQAGGHGRYLFVEPALRGPWIVLADDPFLMGLPADVSPGVSGFDGNWTTIHWAGPGEVRVDGVDVELPHTWTFRPPDAAWHIDARLTQGPARLEVVSEWTC